MLEDILLENSRSATKYNRLLQRSTASYIIKKSPTPFDMTSSAIKIPSKLTRTILFNQNENLESINAGLNRRMASLEKEIKAQDGLEAQVLFTIAGIAFLTAIIF